MDRVAALIARSFAATGGELCFGPVTITAIAARFGTPLYLYAADLLDRQWSILRDTYPPRFSIFYSLKANPNPAIVGRLVAKGCGLEVASAGELAVALRAGCPPARILFAGPGKTEAELELALRERIGEIHIESRREAERLTQLARQLGVRAPVAVRVNPAEAAQGGAMRMGGKPAPFGVDEEALDDLLEGLASEPAIHLRGLHLFAGTQILDTQVLIRQYGKGIELARHLSRRLGHPPLTLDLGGGLGVPYFPGESALDMPVLKKKLFDLVTEINGDSRLAGTHFIIEPGRYLVAEAGIYVTRVTDVKSSRGKTFVILDGGMHHHLAASGNLGQVIKRNFPIAILDKLGKDSAASVNLVGPLCTPLDTIGRDVALPEVAVGDLVGVFQSGAYGLTASPVHFLGHRSPPEVLVLPDGDCRLIRPRGQLASGNADE